MKVPGKSGGNDRIGAMLRDLPASFDEVQVGRSRRQEQQRDAQLRVQRLHHFRVLMADETPRTSTFLYKCPSSAGDKLFPSKLVRVSLPTRRPPRQPVSRSTTIGASRGDLPSAERRGLEALPEPAQQIRQERKHALTESLQHASAVRDQDEPEGRCVVPAAVKS